MAAKDIVLEMAPLGKTPLGKTPHFRLEMAPLGQTPRMEGRL